MPLIMLRDPWGTCYQLSSGRPATIFAWFDEVAPIVNRSITVHDVPAARIQVMPMFVNGTDSDWVCDPRVLGRLHEFPALDGLTGMILLSSLRDDLEAELGTMGT